MAKNSRMAKLSDKEDECTFTWKLFSGWDYMIGHPETGFKALGAEQLQQVAKIAAGFVGLLSLFNIAGRFFWASTSDKLGRKTTYFVFFLLGIILFGIGLSQGASFANAFVNGLVTVLVAFIPQV